MERQRHWHKDIVKWTIQAILEGFYLNENYAWCKILHLKLPMEENQSILSNFGVYAHNMNIVFNIYTYNLSVIYIKAQFPFVNFYHYLASKMRISCIIIMLNTV